MLSTKECFHIFHSRQIQKKQVLQNTFSALTELGFSEISAKGADFSALLQKLRYSSFQIA